MLSTDQLADIYRNHRNDVVLSIYLDADQHDFGERDKWRVALKTSLAEQKRRAEDPGRLERAYEHLAELLDDGGRSFLSGRGWVGFATPEERLYAEGLPVPMPNLVRWEKGIRVAPYARALKSSRPVIGAIVDSRHAKVLRFRSGALTERSELEADTYLGDLTDIHVPKRASDRSGVRGKTGTDAAQRFLEVERDRLLAKVASEIEREAGNTGFVLLGGVERAAQALKKALSFPEDRLVVDTSLSFDSPARTVQEAVERAASTLSSREHGKLLRRAVDQARANGDGCLGEDATERALLEQRVDTLLVSDTLRRERPDRVDHFEGSVFEQGARVVELSREVGAELDREAGGVAALLRYRIRPNEAGSE